MALFYSTHPQRSTHPLTKNSSKKSPLIGLFSKSYPQLLHSYCFNKLFLFFLHRLLPSAGHLGGVGVGAALLQEIDGRLAIRTENETEQLGKNIIEFLALTGTGINATFGAASLAVFKTAFPHLAPTRPLILPAPRTFFAFISPAFSAIQSAKRD